MLRAVTYAALFDYPLTLQQLRDSLDVVADEDTIVRWWRTGPLLQATVDYRDGLFFPRGRADLALTRARREAFSRQMLERDRRILSFVSAMPFVRMVALSGSLAHLNAEGVADLDLFVITRARRVWSVTLTILIVARLLGWRQAALPELRHLESGRWRSSRRTCSPPTRSSTSGRSRGGGPTSDLSMPIRLSPHVIRISQYQRADLIPRAGTRMARARAVAGICAGGGTRRASALRLASQAAIQHVAVKRTGATRTRVSQAAYQQPPRCRRSPVLRRRCECRQSQSYQSRR